MIEVSSIGKIWVGGLPQEWVFESEKTTELKMIDCPKSLVENRVICVNLTLHKFNHSSGILGASFTPNDSKILSINIGHKNKIDSDKIVQVGISDTYAQVISDEVSKSESQIRRLGGGMLAFYCGAWHQLNSNKFMFRVLTQSVITLLTLEPSTLNQEVATEHIKKVIQNLVD